MSKLPDLIPYGKHIIDDSDIEAVVDILRNRFLTQGETVPEFENALCRYTGAKYATAVNSATSGLHVACLSLGVGDKDLVWTVPNSFVASANCARYCGAEVDFVDIDTLTRNISIESLKHKLRIAEERGKLPKVLIVVHFSGLSCDMKSIAELAKHYQFSVIEDAAHGLGGEYQGSKIGSCQYSDMSVLSFHPVKSITTAEGGAVMTNNEELNRRAVLFAKHGVTRDPQQMKGASEGPWYYQQIELGYNYRLSDLHAALGISQLRKLDSFIAARNNLAMQYSQKLAELPVNLPITEAGSQSAWHLYMIEVLSKDRADVFQELKARGVGVNVHYIPVHLHPYYQSLGFKKGDFPNAEQFYERAITLPLFPTLSSEQQETVITALNEVMI